MYVKKWKDWRMEHLNKFRKWLTIIQPILLWLMALYFAETFISNGIKKFDPEGFWAKPFARWGYPVWFTYFIGVLETVGGVLLLVPKFRYIGGLTLAVVMLGAIITRAIHGIGLDDATYMTFAMVTMWYMSTHLGKVSEADQVK